MAYELKEMNVGQILDQAMKITQDHFKLLFGIVAIVFLPLNLIASIVVGMFLPDLQLEMQNNPDPEQLLPVLFRFYAMLAPILLVNLFFVYPLTNASILYATTNVYLNRPVTIKAAILKGLRLIPPLIATNILWFLAFYGGMLLCFVPGIIFAMWFFLCNYVVVVEDKWGTAALGRSRQLMKGSMGTLMLLGFVLMMIQGSINGMLSLLKPPILQLVLTNIASAAAMVFVNAGYVVFYFSCRCKVEQFDLDMLADSVATDDELPKLEVEPT